MRAVLSPEARRDLREILIWSENHFSRKAAERYDALLKQALRDIETNPQRMGSQDREELAESIHTYRTCQRTTLRLADLLKPVATSRGAVIFI